jgi:hypothetical protein
MSWARIDDQMCFHRKVVSAGNSAVGAWIRIIAWSSAHLSDGRVPERIARLIGSQRDLDACLREGLLERDGVDYLIHDYLEWNPSAMEVAGLRAHQHEIRSLGGKARAGNANRVNGRFLPAGHQQAAGSLLVTPHQQATSPIPSGSHPVKEKALSDSPKREAAKRLIAEFNRIGGKSARVTETNIRAFEARLADTAEEDIAGTMAHRHRKWSEGDGSMLQYFAIETLTRPSKFETYYTDFIADRSKPNGATRRLFKPETVEASDPPPDTQSSLDLLKGLP